MTVVTPTAIAQEPASAAPRPGFMSVLAIPAVDKGIAIVAVVPFIYALYLRLAAGTLNIPRACVALSLLITIVTMLLRRAPVRVTPNPLWWLLAFAATYGPLAWAAFAPQGRALVPDVVTSTTAIVSVIIVVYARLSLGRNIGFVPAQREIVQSGAYRYVRHPIYSGLFLAWASLALRLFSLTNVALLLTIYTLIVIKSIVEERFLREDPTYARYLQEVKYRFIPGVV